MQSARPSPFSLVTARLLARFVLCLFAVAGCGGGGSEAADRAPLDGAVPQAVATSRTFVNPIVPAQGSGGSADPSIVFRDGYYHYCRSLDGRAIGVAKARRLQDIGSAPMVTVWTAPPGPYSQEVWAPELQYLQGRWIIYFAASDGQNVNHRMYALAADSADPQRGYTFKGKVAASVDSWAIDGLAIESAGALYFVWSGWRGPTDGFPQVTYIAPMSDPWTISGERREISAPELGWEQAGASLQEGASVLYREGRIYLVYSASGSWTDDYALGLLTYSGGDILDRASWVKSTQPVFTKRPDLGTFGPGHNTFVTSPDGTEDWIVYHAIDTAGGGWARRSIRAQRFDWNADGSPRFSDPVGLGVPVREPSGSFGSLDLRRLPESEPGGLLLRFASRSEALGLALA